MTFQADPGETNALDINTVFGPGFVVDSGAELTALDGCVSVDLHTADCNAGLPFWSVVDAYLDNRDDTAHLVIFNNAFVWAGAGNDTVYGDSFAAGGVHVYGEAGNDDITAFGEGGQLGDGGPGNDVIHTGGFIGPASGFGGPGNDAIDAHWTTLFESRATLDGGEGNDTITAETTWFPSTASGGNGDDVITIDGPLHAPLGGYTISGGAGNDTLTGGGGNDSVDGGSGNDYIDVRGGDSDTVVCGSGNDVVLYDASDTIAADCETSILS